MKVGVLDTDGKFQKECFRGKNIDIIRKVPWSQEDFEKYTPFTHGEYVCSFIWKENPSAKIVLLAIVNSKLKCSVKALIEGIDQLIQMKVDIINLSLGDEYYYHEELKAVCDRADQAGIVIVAAYSNHNVCTYPAAFHNVIGVRCEDSKQRNQIFEYDENSKNILFWSSFFSVYGLGIPRLYPGNSFACATVSGILSNQSMTQGTILAKIEHSPLNCYFPYPSLKEKRCFLISNRKEEELQKKFAEEVTNACFYEDFMETMQSPETLELFVDQWEVLFIDHDTYKEAVLYKEMILRIAKKHPKKEMVLRYPLFGLYERYDIFRKDRVWLKQFYI